MSQSQEKRIIFALAPAGDGGPPVLTLLMTEESWNHMRDGKTHEFDMTNIGIPIRLLLAGTKDHASGMEMIRKMNTEIGIKDVRGVDLRFGQERKPQ